MTYQQLTNIFKQNFNKPPEYSCRSPGRVNLIGGHTDYNDGFVFPLALNVAIHMVMCPRQDNKINILSANFSQDQLYHIDINDLRKSSDNWDEYVKGMIWAVKQHYQQQLKGFDAVLISDLPIGAGLSSSAAFKLIIGRALAISNHLDWKPIIMAKLAQQAENKWIGVNCGIMDQFVIAAGKKNHALFIDCRMLTQEYVPLPKDMAIVIMDTATRRGLVNSAYNERRQQCEEVAKAANYEKLRDVSIEKLHELKPKITSLAYKRAYHIISENARVVAAKQAMQNGNLDMIGKLITESHNSLRDYFEVSNQALNAIVELANKHPSCYGARMTGAGFGGCAVALVKYNDMIDDFVERVSYDYKKIIQLEPKLYICSAEDGTNANKL